MQRLLNMWNKEEKTCSICLKLIFCWFQATDSSLIPTQWQKKSQRTWFLRNKLTSWYAILYDKNVGCNIYLMNLINRKEACRTHATSPPILTYYLQMQEVFFLGLTKKKERYNTFISFEAFRTSLFYLLYYTTNNIVHIIWSEINNVIITIFIFPIFLKILWSRQQNVIIFRPQESRQTLHFLLSYFTLKTLYTYSW